MAIAADRAWASANINILPLQPHQQLPRLVIYSAPLHPCLRRVESDFRVQTYILIYGRNDPRVWQALNLLEGRSLGSFKAFRDVAKLISPSPNSSVARRAYKHLLGPARGDAVQRRVEQLAAQAAVMLATQPMTFVPVAPAPSANPPAPVPQTLGPASLSAPAPASVSGPAVAPAVATPATTTPATATPAAAGPTAAGGNLDEETEEEM